MDVRLLMWTSESSQLVTATSPSPAHSQSLLLSSSASAVHQLFGFAARPPLEDVRFVRTLFTAFPQALVSTVNRVTLTLEVYRRHMMEVKGFSWLCTEKEQRP